MINPFLNRLSKKNFFRFLWIVWALEYVFATFIGAYLIYFQRGFFFYLVGAYLKIHKEKHIVGSVKKNVMYLAVFIIAWVIGMIAAYGISIYGNQQNVHVNVLYEKILKTVFSGFIVPACGVTLFLFLSSIRMTHHKWINVLASTTFGIYLLHDSDISRVLIWRDLLNLDVTSYQSRQFPGIGIGIILVIFAIGVIVEMIRQRVEVSYMRKVNQIIAKFSFADMCSIGNAQKK